MSDFTPRRVLGVGSEVDKKTEWALRRAIAEGSVAVGMGNLAGGVFLTGFALALGASTFHIGLLSSLPPIISLVQLFTPPLLRRFGGKRKNLTLFSFGSGRLLWLLLILLPFFAWEKTSLLPTFIIIGVICLSTGFNSIGGISWLSWMS